MTNLCSLALLLPTTLFVQGQPQKADDVMWNEVNEQSEAECPENDAWEPNDTPKDATVLSLGPDEGGIGFDAYLCAGEDDWYLLSFKVQFTTFRLDAIVEGSSFCAGRCEGWPTLPPDPKNTISVEVYNAKNFKLIASSTAEDGRLDLDGDTNSKHLLLHVHGPEQAVYGYSLSIDTHKEKKKHSGEDECEC